MAATRINSNRYRLPPGYLPGSVVLRGSINGYTRPKRGPGHVILGATQVLAIASAPAALSTLILNAPDGKSYTFQFTYAGGAAQTAGILVALPAGGGTAAQVATALNAVLNAGSGTPLAGTPVVFPWTSNVTGGTSVSVNYTINGTPTTPTGTQATITTTTVGPNFNGVTSILPGRSGFIGLVLPGA